MSDEDYMRLAIAEAEIGASEDEVPVGAVAVLDGKVIASEHNRMEQLHDATAHAEILLIRKVSSIIGDWRLSDVAIYVTKEPCVMCGGAMVNAHLKKAVYGLKDPRSGADSRFSLFNCSDLLYQTETVSGVLEDECKAQFQNFFIRRRKEQKLERKSAGNENL